MRQAQTDFPDKCKEHFRFIYGEEALEECLNRLNQLLEKYNLLPAGPTSAEENWTHRDHILITYADMVTASVMDEHSHLAKQHKFVNEMLSTEISTLHLLPFFPSSSDDGFSVVDYRRVDEQCGAWDDIETMVRDYRIMADLVINHVSRHSSWFRKYIDGDERYRDFFIEVEEDVDLSDVTRPRSNPLLTPVETAHGHKRVWSTFSEDQIDLNFRNPDVLFEILDIFFFYLSKGIRVIRLDAVAFIWKEVGTPCIHLPQTHEIVRLFRTLVDHLAPDVTLITETNVPHKENISYFGEGDEAHMVYQFSLPPLLLHALMTENGEYLTRWAASLEELPEGCTYFNFTSSHDGIGVRPLEGLVPDQELEQLVQWIKDRGGFVSYKSNGDKSQSPYELNITYFDAFASNNGFSGIQEKRFLCSQIIKMSLLGVPGIYFHNLTGTRNFQEGVRMTGRLRSINRKKWGYDELMDELQDSHTRTHKIFYSYRELIRKRNQVRAFDPFGKQKVYDVGKDYFVIERSDSDQSQRILIVCNLTLTRKKMDLVKLGLPVKRDHDYTNLLTDKTGVSNGETLLDPYDVLWIEI